ncbi:hypothetical protein HF086_011401 [Spodoptera exigua]|uniref:Uncharacterized protein n=1 Tax=Spodoptera exigua TaxID=7107 RepID=A0A922N019_SPOEX|nr:hypothetical protein HF086_011401 [Spodoptera exigua]
MPVSVHKILFYGKDIITACVLPIGQMSEEAQEARNKHNRRFREHFTRKSSRINKNRDLLNRLLISSDPYIASLRAVSKTKRGKIKPEVNELLEIRIPIEREIPLDETDRDSDGSESESEDSDESIEESDEDSEESLLVSPTSS